MSNVANFCNIWKVSLHLYVFITWSFSKYMFSFFLCVHNFCLSYVSKFEALKNPSMFLFPFYSLELSYILKIVMFYVCQYTSLICMYYGCKLQNRNFWNVIEDVIIIMRCTWNFIATILSLQNTFFCLFSSKLLSIQVDIKDSWSRFRINDFQGIWPILFKVFKDKSS
jgi:hypothetical protein